MEFCAGSTPIQSVISRAARLHGVMASWRHGVVKATDAVSVLDLAQTASLMRREVSRPICNIPRESRINLSVCRVLPEQHLLAILRLPDRVNLVG
jgi:hypothetical protein